MLSSLNPKLNYRFFFFFNDTATTEIYTLSLHDALPIYAAQLDGARGGRVFGRQQFEGHVACLVGDRKSTRLNSSHLVISYAVFCLKKKKIVLRMTQEVAAEDGAENLFIAGCVALNYVSN